MNTLLRYSFVTSLVLFASISIPAYAQVPQIAAVPQNLPVSARLNQRKADLQKWHDGLKARTDAHRSKCTGVTVGTPLDKWCGQEQTRLEGEKAKYIAAVNKFNGEVTAAASRPTVNTRPNSPPTSSRAEVIRLEKLIAQDEKEIRALGLDKRAKDFEDWEKMAEDARKEFEEQTLDSIVELLSGAAMEGDKAAMKSIGSMNPFSSQELIGKLKSRGINNERLWESIRELGTTTGKPERARAAREFVEMIEKEAQLQTIAHEISNDPEKIRTQAEAVATILSWGLKGPMAGFLQSDVQFMFASLYNNAARRVSVANVERLDALTESQLKDLKRISDRLKDHVEQRNRARQDLANLSGNNAD